MAVVPKTEALETLLREMWQAQSDREISQSAEQSADDDGAFAGKVIILMILSKLTHPMPLDELMKRSELTADQFDRILAYLVRMHWVEASSGGLVLTDAGRKAAEEERKRLLSFG